MSSPEERFTTLFDSTHKDLLAYSLRRVGEPADAADVVAESFLVAWRRLDDIPDGDERPWLFGVARRVLANQHRGMRRRRALADRLRAELVAVIPAPAAHEPSTIERALSQLGEADRELLCLVAWEELTPTEIAVAMNLPAGTVRVRLHRARARLSKAMEALDGVPVKRRTPTGHVEGGTASVAAEEV